jgi:hypothetical protein
MNIKIERTSQSLSSLAGLIIFKELFLKTLPDYEIDDRHLPVLKSGLGRSISKLRQLVYGFLAGAQCLDDFDRLANDFGFRAICDEKVYTAKAHGDFLRSLSLMHSKELNQLLTQHAFRLRHQLFPQRDSITFDIDSTSNEQFSKKMEGVAVNYQGVSCLDTIQVFDELGFQYWNDVRPGNTHTSSGSTEIIHRILASMPTAFLSLKRFVRADSGYCKKSFFEACAIKNAQFVVCMRKLMYQPLIHKVATWTKQDPLDVDRIVFVGGRACEVGETQYRPRDSHLTLRVVVLRAVKLGREYQLIHGEEDYDYQGWVSSIDGSTSAVEVIKFYRGRGHAENFIRELKNGMDLHHYPCQLLHANKAFGILAAFAHNLLRFIALKDDPRRPQFAKAIRIKYIHVPCQVVRHARDLILRLMDSHFEGVIKMLMGIRKMATGLLLRSSRA